MHPRPKPESPPDDSAPLPPTPPQDGECCESGCDNCVWTLYGEARARYERDYAAWLARMEAQLARDE